MIELNMVPIKNFAKLLLDVLVIYVVVSRGNRLTNRAYTHLRDRSVNVWFSPLFDATNFTDEGQPARERALHFWRWAIPIACVCLLLIGLI